MMQINDKVLENLSARGRGYFEAVQKLAEAKRLEAEALQELAHLDGKKLKARGLGVANGGGEVVTAKIKDLARPPLTIGQLLPLLKKPLKTGEIAARVGFAREYVRRLLAESKQVYLAGSGNQVRWTLRTPKDKGRIVKRATVANKTTTRRPSKEGGFLIDVATKFDEIKEVVAAGDGWTTRAALIKAVGISPKPMQRALEAMARKKIIKEVHKRNNPAHKDPRAFANSFQYWVLA